MAISDDITALKQAIRQGAHVVRYDGHSVEYRSLAEMRSILREMEAEAGKSPAPRVAYPAFDKGNE